MWGPADLEENGSRPTVPYRTKVGQEQIAPMSADSLVIKIEADLREANSLLVNDPCVWNNDTWQPEYLRFRQHRLNKWAVRGLMARFFLYTNRPDSAAHYALDVVEHCGRSLVTNMSNDHALFDESLFTLHYANMTDDLQNYFSSELHGDSQTQKLITPGNLEYIFETTGEGANDIRGRSGQGFLIQNNVCMSRKFLTIENAEYDYKVPLIRLAEMYYILAETLTGMDAVNYYNDIRNSRGVSSIYNLHAPFATEAEKVKRLTKEYAKEFFGEGQYFFFLKRHQASEIEVGYDDHVFPMEERFYEFEIPDAEKEYGLVPEN